MDNIIKFPNAEQRLAREILKKYETHAPTLIRLAKSIDLDYKTTTESRKARTHRKAFTFGNRYGICRDDESPHNILANNLLSDSDMGNKFEPVRVCCDYCGHNIPTSIQQDRDGYVPPSVCETCAIDINRQLDELAEEYGHDH